jgi:hypothetical protein
MKDANDIINEPYRWTAFMKLNGETSLRNEKEILGEFEAFVQSLQRVGVAYDIIVMVEGKAPQKLHTEYNTKAAEARVSRGEWGP